MAEYIELGALMQFPIRRDHYDRENGNENFINGIETVLEYAEQLPTVDAEVVVRCRDCINAEPLERNCEVNANFYMHCRRANGRPVPNNPAKAYELGRLDGTKQCMDNVSCVLLDKCGFHVREETADEHDTRSLEYLQQCLVELVEAKNNGYVKIADIEKALRGEYKMVNSAE